ncbi:hypothetical protein AB6A40_008166 [Gnathostoma spinigerum]|uniref:Transcription initiation factor TFIID subunit 2 n=1 Tax=Gnathostoma spinigerum TaxID=75299 RepID=A0ABD6EXX5_9BILA
MQNSSVPPATYSDGVIAGGESSQNTSAFLNCNFRVLSQSICISNVDFKTRSFLVFTELCIVPIHPELRQICLNIGHDAQLPNEWEGDERGHITVNEEEAEYTRRDPFHVLSHNPDYSLRRMANQMYEVQEDSEGELVINVPEGCYDAMDEQQVVKVGIDVRVVDPKQGIQFISHFARDGSLEKGAHFYTYRSNIMSSTRQWLPCFDAPDQLALWRIDITVDTSLMVVASGELVDCEYTPDMRNKIYRYQMLIPTSAINIGFAIGHFTPCVLPEMTEVISFALPTQSPLVKHTASTVDKVFEFFEELLSCRFPYTTYKQVFVDQASDEVTCFSGLTILSVTILYHKKILDAVQVTRQWLAHAVAQQFFGCFVNAAHWLDLWLMRSLARFITGLFIERYFGTCEHLFQMKKMLNAVCKYENRWGKLYLRLTKTDDKVKDLHFDPRNNFTCSPLYADMLFKKGHFVMRMLNKRLGKEPFFQVVHKILSVSMQFSQKQREPMNWQHMTVSTESFFRTVSNVTGQELPTFLEQWIYGGGHADFQVQYAFNRKRNMIELEIRQDPKATSGRQSYVGPVTVVVQELDGSFTHTVQIDTDHSKHDLQCHSKGRRQKKKKIPLSTGEELEIDLTNMDPDSPVLWLRLDPDLHLVRRISIRQPVYQWEYMLKYERDVLAQLQALDVLQRFPSPHIRTILLETIENESFFYRVRCGAAFSLTEVVNKLPETWLGPPALMVLFKKLYGCKSAPHMPRPNNFVITAANLQSYFLMQALPQALARLRTSTNSSPAEVHRFLLGLLKYNDNSMNRYSDDHYRASLITSLACTIVPADNLDDNSTADTLNSDMKEKFNEFSLALNMDTLKPTFGRVVGIAALNAIYQAMRNAHIPIDPKLFIAFSQPKIYTSMRQAALSCLVDIVARFRLPWIVDVLDNLLGMSFTDTDPSIRYHIATELCRQPPFFDKSSAEYGPSNPANTKEIALKIWSIVMDEKTEARLRCLYIDLYFTMYGNGIAPVLAPPGVGRPSFVRAEKTTSRLYSSSAMDRPMEMSGSLAWHITDLEIDEPYSPINRSSNEMTDDMLQ